MNNIDLIEDFIFVDSTIRSTHPMAVSDLPTDFNEYASTFVNKATNINELIYNLSKFTALLHDGHTNIEVEYSNNNLCINLPSIWLHDGLYARDNYHGILKGDKIINIAELAISDILDKLCEIIPHENTYLVKVRSTTYPFVNYHIFSEFMLRNMGALSSNNIVNITVLRDGHSLTFSLPLEKYNGFLDFKENDKFIDFWIENDVAILKLDECRYNDEYLKRLKDFFRMVKENSIQNIIVDLRENMGGGSKVVNEFLKYISIDSYYFYGVKIRNQSENRLKNINSVGNVIPNNTNEDLDLFNGKIICIISNKTFSSARIFATVLKDNNLATIVGEPTGGKPSSYGNALRFETPNFKIKFRVSSRTFTRPAQKEHDDIALLPDISIYPTIKDILCKNDVVLNKALMLCSKL